MDRILCETRNVAMSTSALNLLVWSLCASLMQHMTCSRDWPSMVKGQEEVRSLLLQAEALLVLVVA